MEPNTQQVLAKFTSEHEILIGRISKLSKAKGKKTQAREQERATLLVRFAYQLVVLRINMAMSIAQLYAEASHPHPKHRKGGMSDGGLIVHA